MATLTGEAVATLHGQAIGYRTTGAGDPTAVLVHGIGQNSTTWNPVLERLEGHPGRVLAVDLPGHGRSAKGRGDYSLGAMASTLRDLLDHLGVRRCVVVGHSLGGGVAMQFSYQFPERCDGLVLVASGGLGPEAFAPLRAATLPGAELVIPLLAHERVLTRVGHVSAFLTRIGLCPEAIAPEVLKTLAELADPASRTAFLATLRGVVDISGQRVSAVSKLPSARMPVLLVWGDRDRVIPIEHGRAAHDMLPNSRLVVFPGGGHEPHRFDPDRFAELLLAFVDHPVG